MASQFGTGALLKLIVLLDSYSGLTTSTERDVLETGRMAGKVKSNEVAEAAHRNLDRNSRGEGRGEGRCKAIRT